MQIISTNSVVLALPDARKLSSVVFAAADMAKRHGARLDPRVLHLAAQIHSATGKTEQAQTQFEEHIEYERISTSEAANILGCSPRNVRELALRGRIPGTKDGKQWWFNRDDIEVYRDWR